MIDWPARVRELQRMADELELWVAQVPGRGRLVLGRIADELRQFAGQIERALEEPDEPDTSFDSIPDWLADPIWFDEDEPWPDVDIDEDAYG